MQEEAPRQKEEPQSRTFITNRPDDAFKSNSIKSTTTNVLTFVPINLFKQLKNMANIYFIIIAILQTIPSISVTGGSPTILLPLAFVMLAVMFKDAYEEYYRYRKDKEENQREVDVLVGNKFQITQWGKLRVGEVIKFRKDTLIPCDCMVIKSSDPENKAFVETKGLDGETNLKLKMSFLNNIPNNVAASNDYHTLNYEVNVGAPVMQLHRFDGSAELSSSKLKIPLDSTNLLLRGCLLKNVHEVIAVCCYTGPDTKVVLNSAKFQPKKSKLMVQVDKIVIQIFIWQVIISLICALFNVILENSYPAIMQYIPSSNYWILSTTWWLLLTYFVPISLMVTMEMVKLFQGSTLVRDTSGYSAEYDFYTTANNTSVNENLGQIKYVFTDKTGTLTKNNMIFKNLIVNGKLYGSDDMPNQPLAAGAVRKTVDFKDDSFQREKGSQKIQDALRVLSLCHEIAVQMEGDVRSYNSSSPDEVALIYFALQEGKELLGQERRMIKIAERRGDGSSAIVQYEKLCVLEFNSDRKRMSVIVRDPQTRRIQLLTKGADSTVKVLLKPGQSELGNTQQHIDDLSIKGLRTLMMGKKFLTDEQYNNFNRDLQESRSIIGQEKKDRIASCYEKIQRNLQLVGATAIEDELQDEVKETIQAMRLSGMMFYILTGDKRETAETIGRSCGLIDSGMKTINIPEYTEENDREWRMQMLKYTNSKESKVFMLNAEKNIPPDIPLHSTICYRCTPKNKEQVVRRVKEKTTHLTMAVGDGSNDVNMIKEAHVGIGIKGKQGSEAARVADYVAGEFKFIKLLTLYYGREWYRKNCELVNYCFYKNWFQQACILAYGGFSFFSGVVFFNSYIYQLYNVLFTAIPIIVYALFDQEYTRRQSYTMYNLYQPGINNQHFNQSSFLKTIGLSILHGIIALLVVFQLLEAGTLDQSGITGYLQLSGSVLFGVIIIIVNLKIMSMSTGVSPLIALTVIISVGLYWASQALFGILFHDPTQFVLIKEQWSYGAIYWVTLILSFFLVIIQFGYNKYHEFRTRYMLIRKKQALSDGLFDKIERQK